MSVIVAFHDGEETWIGSDTMALCDNTPVDVGRKWHSGAQGWWIGHVGTHRLGNLIRDHAEMLTDRYDDQERDIVKEFSQRLIGLFDRNYIRGVYDSGAIPNWANGVILARPGRIVDFDPQLAYADIPAGTMVARGAGADYALGAYHAMTKMRDFLVTSREESLSPYYITITCIEAAEANNVTVRGNWLNKLKESQSEPIREQV
jgi:hypothetical protein